MGISPPPPDNCNGTLIHDEAYYEEWHSPRLGFAFLLLGIIYCIPYIPCLIAMLDKDLWSNSCYKIMFSVGVFDICTMCFNSILPGIYMIIPFDYPCYRTFDFLLTILCSFFWDTYCIIVLVLGINRSVQLVSEKWSTILFGGKRVWCWIAGACIYGSLFIAVYLSPYGSFSFHTGIGLYVWHKTDRFGLLMSMLNNSITAVVIVVEYAIILLIVRCSRAGINLQQSKAEKRIQLQALIICGLTCTAAGGYGIAGHITDNPIVFQALHIVWISSHGCNGLVYLTLNKTIRNKVKAMLRMKVEPRTTASSSFIPIGGYSKESPTTLRSIKLTLTESPEETYEL